MGFFQSLQEIWRLWQETARKMDFYIERMTYGCTNLKQVRQMFSLSKHFSLCPAEALNHVELWTPKSITDAAT